MQELKISDIRMNNDKYIHMFHKYLLNQTTIDAFMNTTGHEKWRLQADAL